MCGLKDVVAPVAPIPLCHVTKGGRAGSGTFVAGEIPIGVYYASTDPPEV